MPLNPMIPLAGKNPSILDSYSKGLMNLSRVNAMKNQQDMMPFKLDALRQQQSLNEQQSQINQQDIDTGEQRGMIEKASQLHAAISSKDMAGIQQILSEMPPEVSGQLMQTLQQKGGEQQVLSNLENKIKSLQSGQTGQLGGKNVANSKMFPNGTSVSIRRDGSKVVTDASGNILTGQDAIDAVNAGIESDVALSGGKAGASSQASSDVDLNMQPQITEAVETTKSGIKIPTELKIETQKANVSRIKELRGTRTKRSRDIKKATQFLRAFKNGGAESGAKRTGLGFIPGVFTDQGVFDEKFNSFSEVAARSALKASGELRPTDADVEGMKRAMFGVGRHKQTNIDLLGDFINGLRDQDEELDDLLTAQKNGNLSVFTVNPNSGKTDFSNMSDEDLFK